MQFYPLCVIGILVAMFGVFSEAELPSTMTQDYCTRLHISQLLLCQAQKRDQKRGLKEYGRQKSPYILKRQLNFINKWPYTLWHFIQLPLR